MQWNAASCADYLPWWMQQRQNHDFCLQWGTNRRRGGVFCRVKMAQLVAAAALHSYSTIESTATTGRSAAAYKSGSTCQSSWRAIHCSWCATAPQEPEQWPFSCSIGFQSLLLHHFRLQSSSFLYQLFCLLLAARLKIWEEGATSYSFWKPC